MCAHVRVHAHTHTQTQPCRSKHVDQQEYKCNTLGVMSLISLWFFNESCANAHTHIHTLSLSPSHTHTLPKTTRSMKMHVCFLLSITITVSTLSIAVRERKHLKSSPKHMFAHTDNHMQENALYYDDVFMISLAVLWICQSSLSVCLSLAFLILEWCPLTCHIKPIHWLLSLSWHHCVILFCSDNVWYEIKIKVLGLCLVSSLPAWVQCLWLLRLIQNQ